MIRVPRTLRCVSKTEGSLSLTLTTTLIEVKSSQWQHWRNRHLGCQAQPVGAGQSLIQPKSCPNSKRNLNHSRDLRLDTNPRLNGN